MLSAAHRLVQQLGQVDPITQQFLTAADTAASRWQEKDQGIWEIRGAPRDFLYSKLMNRPGSTGGSDLTRRLSCACAPEV